MLNRKQLNYSHVVFEYIRTILPPACEMTIERFLTRASNAEISILKFAMEVPGYVMSALDSLGSSPPSGQGPSRSMTAATNLSLALPCSLSQTRCCPWRGIHICLYIDMVFPNSRVEGVLSSFYSHIHEWSPHHLFTFD